jgi:galactokinase/mevalonate kinase-like predicted kinase
MPIEVNVKVLREPKIIYQSHDLNLERELGYDDLKKNPVTLAILDWCTLNNSADLATFLNKIGGLRIETKSNASYQSGLGASSALTVCATAALRSLGRQEIIYREIAEESYRTENKVHLTGWQDHYSAVFGGNLLITREKDDSLAHTEQLSQYLSNLIEEHCILVYLTGVSRNGIEWKIDSKSVNIIKQMDAIVDEFLVLKDALDITTLQYLISKHWQIASHLWPQPMYTELDSLIKRLKPEKVAGTFVGLGPAAILLFSRHRDEVIPSIKDAFSGFFTPIFPISDGLKIYARE